jgi:hypothetical protein
MVRLGKSLARRSCAFARLIAAPTALLLGSLCANRAAATCGDYLQMDDDHQYATSDSASSENAPAEAPCGCKGVDCRRAPVAPPAPRSLLRFHSAQDGCLLARTDQLLLLYASRTRFDSSERPSRGFPLLLNRPPNALA